MGCVALEVLLAWWAAADGGWILSGALGGVLKGVAGPGLLKEVVGVAASPAALLGDSRCLPGRFGRPAGGQGK